VTDSSPKPKRTRGEPRPVQRNGLWTVRWYDERGDRHRKTFEKQRDAAEFLREEQHRVDLVRKGLPPPVKPSRDRRTFNELADHWLEHRHKRSTVDDTSILRRHLRPAFGELSVEDVTFERVTDWRTGVEGVLAPKTIHNILTLLISLLNEAVHLEWMKRAPTIRKPKIAKMNSRDFKWIRTEAEIHTFLDAARAEKLPGVFELYATAILTGLREGELAGLRRTDVDLERRLIHVQRSFDGPTKSGDDRMVPIVDPALVILTTWLARHRNPLVFPSRKGTMQVESARIFKEVLHRVMARAKMAPGSIVFHSLRHTFASWWMIKGGDLYKLQAILGHSDPKITMRYAHLAPHAFDADRGRMSGLVGEG
jgi:integrase